MRCTRDASDYRQLLFLFLISLLLTITSSLTTITLTTILLILIPFISYYYLTYNSITYLQSYYLFVILFPIPLLVYNILSSYSITIFILLPYY